MTQYVAFDFRIGVNPFINASVENDIKIGKTLTTSRIVVIGGGAAGFFGAVACAQANPHILVTLLEASQQLLSKVRVSGGGRCNVTHACFEPAGLIQNYPRGAKALRGAFARFQATDTVAWFGEHGVKLKTEADGRMFPVTDDSQTIVDCLVEAAQEFDVKIRTASPVVSVDKQDSGFEITLKSGETLRCNKVLLATGSNPAGYKIAAHLGHEIVPPVPSLFTFNVIDPQLRALAGVSVNTARLRLSADKKLEQVGPLLITHWGLSGPAVLKLSAWGARVLYDTQYKATFTINWLPDLHLDAVQQKILEVKAESGKRAIALHRGVEIPLRLWQYLVARAGIGVDERWAELSKKALQQLLQELTQGEYSLQGKGVFKEEFVTCGGVNLKEVDFKTMESRIVPGLYFAGEILDIDGVTGGFNFQSAWTTAHLAGTGMAGIQK